MTKNHQGSVDLAIGFDVKIMLRNFHIFVVAALAISVHAPASHADVLAEKPTAIEYSVLEQSDIEPLFRQLAKEVTFFPIESFLHDRDDFHFRPKAPDDERRYAKLKQILSREKNGIGTLHNLLRDDDPKVRTLVLAALFTKTDAQQTLPYFASFADDDAPTFDGHPELDNSPIMFGGRILYSGDNPPQKAQTVGYIARAMMRFYMTRSGFYYGYDGYSGFMQEEKSVVLERTSLERAQRAERLEPGFALYCYWNERKDRTYCSSWFEVQFERARESTTPTPEDAAPKLRALRERINRLPRADRNWTILSLRAPDSNFILYNEAEVVAACKELGSKNLMLMLQNRAPSSDPDLKPNSSPNSFKNTSMKSFVLKHAKTLLRPEDAAALLKQEQIESRPVEGRWFSAQWAIAAADLQPAQAKTSLYNAWKRFGGEYQQNDRTMLALSLLNHGGQSEVAFARSWIFKEPQQPRTYPGPHGQLFDMLRMKSNKNAKHLAAVVIADPQLNSLNFQSLSSLIQLVNKWLPKPVISAQEMYYIYRKPEEATKMTKWRQKLRASVPQWNKN